MKYKNLGDEEFKEMMKQTKIKESSDVYAQAIISIIEAGNICPSELVDLYNDRIRGDL